MLKPVDRFLDTASMFTGKVVMQTSTTEVSFLEFLSFSYQEMLVLINKVCCCH